VLKIRTYSATLEMASPKDDPKPVPYDEKRKERLSKWEQEVK